MKSSEYRRAAVFCSLVLFFVCAASAQPSRSISNAGRRVDEFNRQVQKSQRDELRREMAGKRPTKDELMAIAAKKEQLKEDLEGLQEEYNKLVLAMRAGKLSESVVERSSSTIYERAGRLRTNLSLPGTDKGELSESDGPGDASGPQPVPIRNEVSRLCLRIYDFLTSPMVENPAVVDAQTADRTLSALEEVIAISKRLRDAHVPRN